MNHIMTRLLNSPAYKICMGIFAVAGVIIGVLSLIIPIISQPRPDLVYAVSAPQTRIVSKIVGPPAMASAQSLLAGLDVTYDGEDLGNTDVTVVQVAIWNRGKEAITKDMVLFGVSISTPGTRILQASVQRYSRDPRITGFKIASTADSLQAGQLSVDWRILEKNDGGVIQLICAGAPQVDVNMQGAIEGQHTIQEVKTQPSSKNQPQIPLRTEFVFLSVFLLGLSVVGTLFHRTYILPLMLSSMGFLILLALLIYVLVFANYVSVPFPF